METSDLLERSVLKIVEAYQQLKEDRDSLKRKVDSEDGELRRAEETIRNLESEIERYKLKENNFDDLISKKHEIKEQIQGIIQRIESFETQNTLDQVTNG
ncbi:MAG: hypothetical protein WCU00_06665 [Candidatus Latescibacterota bacterium]